MATARRTTKAAPAQEMRTLQVRDNRGTFRVTIPADWKVTFGAFQQGKFGGEGSALRIYEAENKQRACFVNVQSFFDTSLDIVREVITESGEVTWENGPDGSERHEKKKRLKIETAY